jgi:hypothetical protein
MINGLMMDNHATAYVRYLIRLLTEDDTYRQFWEGLQCRLLTLESCGLEASSPDSLIWHYCQREQVVLVTANRNSEGPDSLEETIKNHNLPTSLPVVTLANVARIGSEHSYAVHTAEVLLQYLVDIESVRGSGRIYVP